MGVEPTIPCVTGRYVTNNTSTPYCDPGQARTDDSYIKSVLLYQLSYEIIFSIAYGIRTRDLLSESETS